MEKKFYVYEFIRLDTMEPFYVGKGCGNRVNDIHRGRNDWFKNIVNKCGVVSNIIIDNLEEKEAYDAEVWYIYEYKHILNYNLVNLDEGGRGAFSGISNPMYGRKGKHNPNHGTKATQSRKNKISASLKGKKKSDEHIKSLKESFKSRDMNGKNNPNFGNGEKISGGKNPAALKFEVVSAEGKSFIFDTKKEVCEFFGLSNYILGKLLGKEISIERDFSREKEKYRHIEGYTINKLKV